MNPLQFKPITQEAPFLPKTKQNASQRNFGYALARFVAFEQKSSLLDSSFKLQGVH